MPNSRQIPEDAPLAEASDALAEAKTEAIRALGKAKKRLERRRDAIRGDLARGAEAQELAAKARWFVVSAGRARRGARELTATDAATGEVLTLALDPARSAREQVDAIFSRARRMQAGMEIARTRLAAAEASLVAIEARRQAALAASSLEEVTAATANEGAPRLPDRLRPRGKEPRRLPYRVFQSSLGTAILVGRRAADNDDLPFHVARPRDLWLHARGTPGAHVIVPLDKGKEPSAEALIDAAHLAAHFSTLRDEATIEIDYAPRGRVRKPRGSAPGLVVVDRAKTLLVRMENDRLARLLATEEPTEGQKPPRR
jgi:predicted ribosome quality control (RQC) complex YloA/Tae2 family protein